MSIQVKRRREAATFLATYTGAQGELIVDTTNNRVQVHDGATPGGFAAAKVSEVAGLAPVQSVAGRSGAVTLAVADVSGAAPLASPALTGTPTAPNAAPGTNSSQVATTSFVAASFVTYAYAGANYATAANATLTGTPTAPTQTAGDNSTRLATTAYADRAASANFARTQVNDAAYTVLASDRTIAIIALTASRTLSLPAASAYPLGATLTLVDESGACSATKTLTIAANGSDTINGTASAVLSAAYGYLALESNGFNKWTIVDSKVPNLAGYMGRNLIINGNFAINQRGYASGGNIPVNGFGHDRWKGAANPTVYTFTQANPALNSAGAATDTLITIGGSSQLQQSIEPMNVAGGTYTVSWAGTAGCTVFYYNGTANVVLVNNLYASPQTFSAPAGVTLTVMFTSGTLGTVQLEAGPVATAFERRPLGVELVLCQRYARVLVDADCTSGVGVANGTNVLINFYFSEMRAAPTASLLSSGNWFVTDGYAANYGATTVSIASSNASRRGVNISLGGFSSIPNGRPMFGLGSQIGTATILLSAEI